MLHDLRLKLLGVRKGDSPADFSAHLVGRNRAAVLESLYGETGRKISDFFAQEEKSSTPRPLASLDLDAKAPSVQQVKEALSSVKARRDDLADAAGIAHYLAVLDKVVNLREVMNNTHPARWQEEFMNTPSNERNAFSLLQDRSRLLNKGLESLMKLATGKPEDISRDLLSVSFLVLYSAGNPLSCHF